MLEATCKICKCLLSLFWHPSGNLRLSSFTSKLSTKELPLVGSKESREDAFHKMQAVSKSVTLEEGSTNLREAQLDETIGQMPQFFFCAVGLRLGLKRPGEELDERGETELVHIVHLEQATEHHEEVRASMGKVSIDIPLLVQRLLQVFGLI